MSDRPIKLKFQSVERKTGMQVEATGYLENFISEFLSALNKRLCDKAKEEHVLSI